VTTAVVATFLAFFAAQLAIELGLAVLDLRHTARAGDALPAALAGRFDAPALARSRAYTLAKGRLGIAHALYGAALTLVLLFSGVLPALDRALAGAELRAPHRFVLFLVALSAITSIAHLPFRLYGTFVVEQRFGFNRTTPSLWVKDRLKSLAVGAAIGVPLLYATWWFMARTGPAWWLWLFGFVTAFQIAMVWLYPAVIAPIFNRFAPLAAGPLRDRLTGLADRAGFRTRGLYVMDASRRSGHSNAYFMGLFRPRIVLFDTMVEKMTEGETAAVLAHEIGHFRLRHVHRRMALGFAGLLLTLWIVSLLLRWPPLFHAFHFAGPSFHAALALFALGGGAFTFFLAPLSSWASRRHEYEADRFAVRLTRDPEALRTALVRLNGENLSNLNPHPWHSAWYDSHPPLMRRVEAIDREAHALRKLANTDAFAANL
jgi:STE24 endopeptidase